jgi:hypothetical protein
VPDSYSYFSFSSELDLLIVICCSLLVVRVARLALLLVHHQLDLFLWNLLHVARSEQGTARGMLYSQHISSRSVFHGCESGFALVIDVLNLNFLLFLSLAYFVGAALG